jgi:glutaredoxin 2
MEPTVVSKFVAIVAIFSFSLFSNLTFAKSLTHSKRVEDYFEMSLTLKEFIELRGMLLDCQAQSHCPASFH